MQKTLVIVSATALVALSVPIVAQTLEERRELFNTLITDEDSLRENI